MRRHRVLWRYHVYPVSAGLDTLGHCHESVRVDLCTRRTLGWSVPSTLYQSLVLDTLSAVLKNRRPQTGLIHHSVPASQYAGGDYRIMLKEAGVTCCMNRKGNCWDNAPAESFFATLKMELIYQNHFETRSEAKRALFAFIEIWCDRLRLYSSPRNMTRVKYKSMIQHQSTTNAA